MNEWHYSRREDDIVRCPRELPTGLHTLEMTILLGSFAGRFSRQSCDERMSYLSTEHGDIYRMIQYSKMQFIEYCTITENFVRFLQNWIMKEDKNYITTL